LVGKTYKATESGGDTGGVVGCRGHWTCLKSKERKKDWRDEGEGREKH